MNELRLTVFESTYVLKNIDVQKKTWLIAKNAENNFYVCSKGKFSSISLQRPNNFIKFWVLHLIFDLFQKSRYLTLWTKICKTDIFYIGPVSVNFTELNIKKLS